MEYAFNGNPHVPASAELPVLDIVVDDGSRHLRIAFIRIDAVDLVYSVEASDDLAEWEEIWNSDEDPDGTANGLQEVVDREHEILPASESRSRFLRVVVTRFEP